jgi:predicted nucleic acid-binding protein
MFVLDTDVISELRKVRIGKADPRVVQWFLHRPLSSFHLSVVSVLEMRMGVVALSRKDPAQAAIYQKWLLHVLEAQPGPQLLPVDLAVAMRCADLHVPDPRGYRDALIAATALVHGMTVVTRNVKDFAPMGVAIVNPWD